VTVCYTELPSVTPLRWRCQLQRVTAQPMPPRKSKLLNPRSIRLDPDVKEVLQAEADEEDRSLSYVINRALRDYVTRKRAAKRSAKEDKD
jgi:predicted HicB family RNase H-like nuclease